jgi:hypothetical protein
MHHVQEGFNSGTLKKHKNHVGTAFYILHFSFFHFTFYPSQSFLQNQARTLIQCFS